MGIEILYGLLAVIIPAVISLTLGGWQNRKTKAEAAKIYHDMLIEETTRREKLEETIRALRVEFGRRVDELSAKIDEQETEIQDLRGWAERLVAQVREHAPQGTEPVPFIRRRAAPKL